MARIKYSGLVESIRGSIGGTTFQKNAYGYTVKQKPNMIAPNTPLQRQQQIYFAQAVRAWGQLTSAQRLDWVTWASSYPQYARHNPSSQLSGFAVFTKVHVFRFMASLAVQTNPVYVTYDQDTINVDFTNTSSVLTLTLSFELDSSEWYVLLFVSRPFSSSKNFIGTAPKFFTSALNSSDDINITSKWLSVYGVLPPDGSNIATGIQFIGKDNGQVLARQSTIEVVI